jgi:hypothetical protein
MANLLICNYCELFGFNREEHPVSRLPIKIGSELFPVGHVFFPGMRVGGFDISQHIDDLALMYFDDYNIIVLHMFVPDGTAKEIFVNVQPERTIYRFGKLTDLQVAYEKGEFLIRPALEYIKREYDEARKDNELLHSWESSPENVKITLQKNNQNITPLGNITFSSILPIDCYILCFSYDYDGTFYEKFKGADSCLIIKDPIAFAERMHIAFTEKMPDFYGINARVSYSKHESPFGILFSKHKDYLYQREYRFVWLQNNPKRWLNILDILNNDEDKLKPLIPEPVKINLGSLSGISALVEKTKNNM